MAKYFPLEGSHESLVRSVSRIEAMRQTAISAASHGDFALALSLFTRTLKIAPYVPGECKSHKDTLRTIEHAMQDSFRKNFHDSVLSLHTQMLAVTRRAANGEAVEDAFDSLIQEHARDMEFLLNLNRDLTYMHSVTEILCKSEGGLPIDRLRGLEKIFSVEVQA